MDKQPLPEQNHSSTSLRRQLFLPLIVLLFLVLATTAVVLYGKGYRLGFLKGAPKLAKTGILHVTSDPTGAQVYIDDHLTTATESTLDLQPGQYTIKISKDNYFPWKKQIRITQEQVTNADASLFPIAPRLDSIATFGIHNPVVDPSGTKIAFEIASQSGVRKNGIYVLNMNTNNVHIPVLSAQSSSIQIADDTTLGVPFSNAKLTWSPDSSQLLATITPEGQGTTTYLLQTNSFNDTPQDITAILSTTQDLWTAQRKQRQQTRLVGLKSELRKMIDTNFKILAWSPDETKILYQASTSATLSLIIKPRLPGINNLPEQRTIKQNGIYVYDIKEDTNIPILSDLPNACNIEEPDCRLLLNWLPDSTQLFYVHDKKISIMDYDGSNRITIYALPFADDFTVPWTDGSKLVILTNLDNPDVPLTLYTIGLK